jgi:hypothetical protein
VEKKIPIKFVVNHHESFAFYFDDPDGNMIEVYWPTGDLSWRQPYKEPLDLSQPDETLLEKIKPPPNLRNVQGVSEAPKRPTDEGCHASSGCGIRNEVRTLEVA